MREARNATPIWVQALLDTALTATEYRVWAYLYWRQGENGKAWPSQKGIADDLHLSVQGIRSIVRRLQGKGWLRMTWPSGPGRGHACEYTVTCPEKVNGGLPFTGEKRSTAVDPLEQEKVNGHSVKRSTAVDPNTIQGTQPKKKKRTDPRIREIFNHWNSYQGRTVEKDGRTVSWHSHKPKADGSLAVDIAKAAKSVLTDYAVEDVKAAIDNYGTVLLGSEYYWSYVWSLPEFLTRRQGREKGALRQLCRFLPDNFNAANHLSRDAQEDDLGFARCGTHPATAADLRRLEEAAA